MCVNYLLLYDKPPQILVTKSKQQLKKFFFMVGGSSALHRAGCIHSCSCFHLEMQLA